MIPKNSRSLEAALLIVLGISLSVIYALKIWSYERGYLSIDLALYANMFYNAAFHGRGFYTEYQSQSLGLSSFLNDHFEPSLLLILPFFRLFPDPRFLLFIPCLAYGTASIFIYLIAARLFGKGFWAFLGAAGFCLAPLQSWLMLDAPHGFHPDCLIPLFAFASFWAFLSNRKSLFWVSLLLLLGIRENMPLYLSLAALLALALGALGKRDTAKILLLSLAFYLAAFVYGLLKGHSVHSFERVIDLIEHPQVTALGADFYSWRWLASFWPSLGFPWAWIPVLVDLLMVSAIGEVGSNWHAFPSLSILALAWILSLKRFREGIPNFSPKQIKTLQILMLLTLAFGLYKNLQVAWTAYQATASRLPRYREAELESLINAIPPEACVAASTDLLPRLCRQERLAWIFQWSKADYVLLNIPNASDLDGALLDPSIVGAVLDSWHRGEFRPVSQSPGGLLLLVRKTPLSRGTKS